MLPSFYFKIVNLHNYILNLEIAYGFYIYFLDFTNINKKGDVLIKEISVKMHKRNTMQ